MKKTLCFISLALIAAFASADVNISHNNSPAGTGNWNFNMYTGTGSTAWGGYLNPVRSFGGDTNISPIERLGFATETVPASGTDSATALGTLSSPKTPALAPVCPSR
jgi:hypothetical protein